MPLVFPAYVGMSPLGKKIGLSLLGVPRIRGDEPVHVGTPKRLTQCSPHTWG